MEENSNIKVIEELGYDVPNVNNPPKVISDPHELYWMIHRIKERFINWVSRV